MRTGKPYDIQPGEVYISPESMEVFKALYPVTGLGFVTHKWAKLFLANWNRAVELWDGGALFYSWKQGGGYWEYQIKEQQEYARLCCTWMLPNGFQEPHVVAEGG